jgi:hypothetical protein
MISKRPRDLLPLKQILFDRGNTHVVYDVDGRGKLKQHPSITPRGPRAIAHPLPKQMPPVHPVSARIPAPLQSPPRQEADTASPFVFELTVLEPFPVDATIWDFPQLEPLPRFDVFGKTWDEAFSDFPPFSRGFTGLDLDFDVKQLMF